MLRVLIGIMGAAGVGVLLAMYNGYLPERTETLNLASIALALTAALVTGAIAPKSAALLVALFAGGLFIAGVQGSGLVSPVLLAFAGLFWLAGRGATLYRCANCGQVLGRGNAGRRQCERCGFNQYMEA